MIGILGATGYTGTLVCAELDARGLAHRRGGRSAARLGALPGTGHHTDHVVDTTSPMQLAAFLDGLTAVVSCVGPFDKLGDPAVDAAVAAGVPYVDSTGEPTFMARVYARHAAAGTPVVPACGFDYVPGDLAVPLALQALEGRTPASVDVVYAQNGMRASRGTARSIVGLLGKVTLTPRRLDADFPDGRRAAVQVPWGELLTVPRLLPGVPVRTAIPFPRPVVAMAHATAPVVARTGGLLRLAKPLLTRLAERLPEGPAPDVRAAVTFEVLTTVTATDGTRARVVVSGTDVYGTTARTLVEAALRVPSSKPGAQTTAQAFGKDAAGFLAGAGLTVRVLA